MAVPKIRFPGFTEDWEQRKFEDIAKRRSDSTISSRSLPCVEYEDVISEQGTLNKDISQKENAKTGIVFESGDVLFGKLRPYLKNWLLPDFNGVAVGDWWILKPVSIDGNFLYRLIQTNEFMSVANVSSGSKMPRSDWALVSKTYFSVPPDISEQRKIGTFFRDIDHTITLHQRKLESMKLLKKSLLQKMFPKSGETVPEVRFPGFTDAWEQRKLSGMATFSKGSGYSKADLKTSGKPIILYGRMYTKYETIIRNVDTFAEEKAGSVYSESGDVIVPASGETAQDISRASVVANSGILLGGDINIIHPNNELNPGFLALTISNGNQQKKLSMKAQGATIVHLHNEDLKGVDILCPSIDEQTLISEFFERIDNTITLHQRKVEILHKLKKSLLQQMFV